MKYICTSCKTVYDMNDLYMDSMGFLSCPRCGRLTGEVFTEKELLEKINYYKELFQILNESTKNE